MNAPLNPALLAPSITGQLLSGDHHYDDTLSLDLYGDWSREEGCSVNTVMIAGTQHNVTTLFTRRQLENLSRYLDHRGDKSADGQRLANTYRSQSGRP